MVRSLGGKEEGRRLRVAIAGFGTVGSAVSRILIDPAALSGPPLTTLAGRWSVERDLVLTAIVL